MHAVDQQQSARFKKVFPSYDLSSEVSVQVSVQPMRGQEESAIDVEERSDMIDSELKETDSDPEEVAKTKT